MKLGWVLIIVLVLLLFHDRIGDTLNSVTHPTMPPGGYYGAPPPGPGYYSSPPSSPATSVTDIINHVIDAGVTLYQGYNDRNRPVSTASPSNPKPTKVDYYTA
jgi:hypothetical protein